ncbi:MAG: dephospho-CoA kinase [Pseudonocardiales bacterium]|nr:MAG: dephospho-CoA kinase [Pseudonocardiales bacterium]
MLRIGLTGGMGSGKSMVAARLAQCGASIIDSDRIAREVLKPGTDGLRAVIGEFGEGILAADGSLDRAALAAQVFSNAEARARLNAIVHPRVAARSAELIAAAPAEAIVVQDIPLLVEVGMAPGFPLVIVVHADALVRQHRLIEQRGVAPADAAARLAAQATDLQRRAVADIWLDNSGCRAETLSAVGLLWTERLVPFETNLRHRLPAARPITPVVVPPDGRWPEQAQRVMVRIAALAGLRAHRLDHIGSTAVSGLAAKDVLDIQVVVADLDAAELLADDLIGAGLIRRDGRWCDLGRDGTTRARAMATNADPGRAVNCHIRPADSPTWRDAVLLRDWLRTHPDDVREYAELKHRLAARRWDSIDAYATAKSPFVASALDRAQRWAARTGWQVG